MSSKADDFITIISKIILEITRFNVPRMGQVSKIDDPDDKGRILVHIPSLGWITDDIGAWCFPVDKKSLITPAVGDWVIVQWIDGNMDLPVYTGISSRMKDMLPDSYTDENNQILFENRKRDFSVRYDETGEVLNMGDGSERFVKGDTAKTEMDKDQALMNALQTSINVWVPVPGDGGIALKTALAGFLGLGQANYANILSDKIKWE